MITCIRTESANPDFQNLVAELDAFLAVIDNLEHDFYAQYNKINALKYVIVAYDNQIATGCGAIKIYDENTMEVKRMFVQPAHRGRGIASAVLKELENWSRELGYKKCILETGKRQPEAIASYQKSGYRNIPNYGQYAGVENSVCFEKDL